MVRLSRRDAGKLLLAGCAGVLAPARELLSVTKIDSMVRGVQLGAQAYSFRDRPLDECIAAFREVGLGECELSEGHFQMANTHGSDLNQWRVDTPLSYFEEVRKKFDAAGISLSAYGYNMSPQLTDEMIERGFQATLAMGLNCITTTTRVSMVPRIDRYAQKYKVMVGYHNHDKTSEPDEVASAESFAHVLKGASPYARINLDIGHFTAANEDPVAFIREHHSQIVTLHLKDRKKDHGPNMPFGEGDTPIIEVLRLLRDNHWKIPANIEYEYGKPGLDPVAEVKKCYAYCRKALES
ncbi:MAG: sugar phosphate isomerase/epimerase family protein [Terriglobia bacterium]